ncbi:MAG: hypothetical protein LBG31_01970 [Prevotellaceae bacterium]|jgi:hypothetical protein|nr:hypothetical protein [Prevotellaceae bacterium]
MRTKVIKTIAILLVLAACFSCGKDDKNCSCGEGNENNESVSLEGTQWKLAGIMDVETCNLKELEPKDCERCYTLVFNTDSTAWGRSSANRVDVDLTVVPPFGTPIISSEISDDGYKFYSATEFVTEYAVTNNELKFFYNGKKNYLLYKLAKFSDPTFLEGTKWKLAGIMDAETDVLKELEPKNCEKCYTLVFVTDSTALGISTANRVNVDLTAYLMRIPTMAGEITDDGYEFYDTIRFVTSYTVTENELKFFYNEKKNYLLYKLQP